MITLSPLASTLIVTVAVNSTAPLIDFAWRTQTVIEMNPGECVWDHDAGKYARVLNVSIANGAYVWIVYDGAYQQYLVHIDSLATLATVPDIESKCT